MKGVQIDRSSEKITFEKASLIRVNVSIEQLRASELVLFIIWGLYAKSHAMIVRLTQFCLFSRKEIWELAI